MSDQRVDRRVIFEQGHHTQIMGIDGTWRRDCTMEDVSEGGAKLVVHRPVEGLPPERVCCLRPALPTAAANSLG